VSCCVGESGLVDLDLPMYNELEARLRTHLQRHDLKNHLLFVNRRGRPFSAKQLREKQLREKQLREKQLREKQLREKQLHPLLDALGIPRGEFHSMRHGAASSLLKDGATPAVVQKQLRHSSGCSRTSTVTAFAMWITFA
jgi:integrase